MAQDRPVGLLLLTGGQGRRLGGPKHLRPHPDGGSWGGHLVRVFETVFPGGPVQLLGEPLPDRPELVPAADPRQGPAVALRTWACGAGAAAAARWWVPACDQVRWTAPALAAWHAQALAVDPGGEHWVLASSAGRVQYLGGWVARGLLGTLGGTTGARMADLAAAVTSMVVEQDGPEWGDLDDPAELLAWMESWKS
jgi:molybdopterin-guanine dinucleotide biosynthesis protein A